MELLQGFAGGWQRAAVPSAQGRERQVARVDGVPRSDQPKGPGRRQPAHKPELNGDRAFLAEAMLPRSLRRRDGSRRCGPYPWDPHATGRHVPLGTRVSAQVRKPGRSKWTGLSVLASPAAAREARLACPGPARTQAALATSRSGGSAGSCRPGGGFAPSRRGLARRPMTALRAPRPARCGTSGRASPPRAGDGFRAGCTA